MNIIISLNDSDMKKAMQEYVERKMPLPHTVTGVRINGPSSYIVNDPDGFSATVTLEEKVS